MELAESLGLVDAWEATEHAEGERGETWGYQCHSEAGRFPPSRMDKILMTGAGTVESVEKVGVGATTAANEWISDHYGLLARFSGVIE